MDHNEIQDFTIDEKLPESEQNELIVFQRAMACLEEEYLQVLNQVHPSQIAIFKLNEAEANEKLRIAANEKATRLSTIDSIYEEEQKSIEKNFKNSKKALFERTSSSISKCDTHLINELKNRYPERRRKFDSLLLDIPRHPQDGQIMQKVQHVIPKPLSISVSDHRDHDFTAIKNEMNSLNEESSMFAEQNSSKFGKSRKSRFTTDLSNKDRVDDSESSDNEDEE